MSSKLTSLSRRLAKIEQRLRPTKPKEAEPDYDMLAARVREKLLRNLDSELGPQPDQKGLDSKHDPEKI
jgi:hypothetical protein